MHEEQCSYWIWGSGDYRKIQCSKKPKVYRNGKWYCTIHDPEYIAAKQAKRDAARKAKRFLDDTKIRRLKAQDHYCANLSVEFMENNQSEAVE